MPVFAFLAFVLASLGLMSCSPSYCGAPCEKPREDVAASKAEKSAKAKKGSEKRDTLPVVVNQYGSFFGHLEVGSMSPPQLRIERSSLEAMLAMDPKDKEILKVLREGKLDTTTFDYNDYSTGGHRFNASGKLRRDATVQDEARRLPRLISESQNRELIERYRHVRRRIKLLPPEPPPAPTTAAVDTSAAPPPPPPRDTAWTGTWRATGDSLASATETFREKEGCEAWGREAAEEFRRKAFGFEYECRKNDERVKRKVW
jgi:hypothetical protein